MRRTAAALFGLALAPLLLGPGCISYPSPGLVLQREASDYKVQLRALRGRVLTPDALRLAERCDEAVRRTDDLAHAGYPIVTPQAREAAGQMRDRCAGVEGWGKPSPDGGV